MNKKYILLQNIETLDGTIPRGSIFREFNSAQYKNQVISFLLGLGEYTPNIEIEDEIILYLVWDEDPLLRVRYTPELFELVKDAD